MRRLSRSVLPELPPSVRQPHYDRESLKIGMAHIGVGAFHRCHQAEFIDDMLEARFGRWGVLGINLTAPSLADLLAPQDCLYSRTLRQDARAETRIIGALREVIDVTNKASAEAAIAALGGPEISVATITVTEKGYCLTPSTGALDLDNPALRADLEGGLPAAHAPWAAGACARSAAADRGSAADADQLRQRPVQWRAARRGDAQVCGFAIGGADALDRGPRHVSIDDGRSDRAGDGAGRRRQSLRGRSARATPARSSASRSGNGSSRTSLPASDRLWTLPGLTFVADAKPYEQIKMRVLNAAQSTLAHQGALVGHEFTYQAAADPVLAALTRRMLEQETSTTLPKLTGMEIAPYIDQSMARIRNTAIRHRCHQIGTDGSQKIVQRLVDPLRERLATGQPAGLLTLAVASWIAYGLSGARRFGARWAPSDPYAETVIAIGEKNSDWPELARAVLSIASDLRRGHGAPAAH